MLQGVKERWRPRHGEHDPDVLLGADANADAVDADLTAALKAAADADADAVDADAVAKKNLLKTSLTDLERMPAIAILLKNLNNLVAKFYAYEFDKAETPAPPRILKKDPNGKYADLNVSAIEAMESRIKKFNPTFGVSKTDCQSFRHKVEHQGLRVRVFKKK